MAPFESATEWENFYSKTTCATFSNCQIDPCVNVGPGQTFMVDATKAANAMGYSYFSSSYINMPADFWGVRHQSGNAYPLGSDLAVAAKVCQQQATGYLTTRNSSLPCHPDGIYPVGFTYTYDSGCNSSCSFASWSNTNYIQGTGPTTFSGVGFANNGNGNYGPIAQIICGTKNIPATGPTVCQPTTIAWNGNSYNVPYGIPTVLGAGTGFCVTDVGQSSYAAAFPGSTPGGPSANWSSCGVVSGGGRYSGPLRQTNNYQITDSNSQAQYNCTGSGWQFAGAAMCGSPYYNCAYGNSINDSAGPSISRNYSFGYTFCSYTASGNTPCTGTYPSDGYGNCSWAQSGNQTCPAWGGSPTAYNWQCQNPANGAVTNCSANICGSTHYTCGVGNPINQTTISPSITRYTGYGITECYYTQSAQAPCTGTYPSDGYGNCIWYANGTLNCPAWGGTGYAWQCKNPADGVTASCTSSN
jgi:hypothetical protein